MRPMIVILVGLSVSGLLMAIAWFAGSAVRSRRRAHTVVDKRKRYIIRMIFQALDLPDREMFDHLKLVHLWNLPEHPEEIGFPAWSKWTRGIACVPLVVSLILVGTQAWKHNPPAQSRSLAQTVAWRKTFGGPSDDIIYAMRRTSDGGFIATGVTGTHDQNGLGDLAGYGELWLLKLDSRGDLEWQKTFSTGPNLDVGYDVQQTSDGGYIITGWCNSQGIITGVDTTDTGDVWLIKTDAQGNEQWNKTFGGSSLDRGKSVRQTSDGGYIIAAETRSFGAGWTDVWLIKTDASGNEQWNQTYGGWNGEGVSSVQQTADGGYMFAGCTSSYSVSYNMYDAWVVKTDSSGNEQWNKTFGGSAEDYAYSLEPTQDGGYIIAGLANADSSSGDMWLIKLDSSGTEQWEKTYGGSAQDVGRFALQTNDGGYVVVGYTNSFGSGGRDAYLVKTDSLGNQLWETTVGGTGNDFAYEVVQTSDGGCVFAGSTASSGAGGDDGWVVKVGP